MTLLEMLRLHGNLTLEQPDPRATTARVTAGRESFDLEIEDVHFATGGGITMVHPVPAALQAAAWAGVPETCEGCQ